MTLSQIEKEAKSALKKETTKEKNLSEKKKNLLKKITEIDRTLTTIGENKKNIRTETKKKILAFAKKNF